MPLDHYVPQVHLRNFYSPCLGDRMYAMRKSDLKSFKPTSQSVCRISDGSTNKYLRENRAIEGFLKQIEPKYNVALAKLAEDNIDHQCVYTIAGFAAYVIGCSPTGVRVLSQQVKSNLETLALDAERSGLIPLPPDELARASLAELLRDREVVIKVDPKYPQAIGITSILRRTAAFGNFKWDILINQFDHNPFFSSDFPVAIEETNDWRVSNWIVPLAPHLAVRIKPDLTVDTDRAGFSFAGFGRLRKIVSLHEIREINRLIVRCAENVVFFRDDLPWVRAFITRNRHFRLGGTSRKVRTDNGSLVLFRQVIEPHAFDQGGRG